MQFRFDISARKRREQIVTIRGAVNEYCRYAPNQGGDETPRENIQSAFYFLRARLNAGYSVYSAAGDLLRVAYSLMDM